MPQPDWSRHRAHEEGSNESDRPWPVDPAAPSGFVAARRGGQAGRPKEPEKDGRNPDDKDGNEEFERERREGAPSRHAPTEGHASPSRARREVDADDTGEWVATERFTLDDELEDTWPTVPTRYLDD